MWIGAHFSFFSVLGHRIPDLPVPLFNVYPASKYALTAITQTIRQELAFQQANIKLTVRMGFPYFFPPKLRQSFKWPHKMKDFYIFHFIRYVWIIRLNTFAYRIVFCGDAGVLNGILFWFPIEKRIFSFTFLKSIRFYYHYLVLSSLWIFKRFHFKALSFCVAFFFLSLTHTLTEYKSRDGPDRLPKRIQYVILCRSSSSQSRWCNRCSFVCSQHIRTHAGTYI